jgi:hypothetical protein
MALQYDYTAIDSKGWTKEEHNLAARFAWTMMFIDMNRDHGKKHKRDFVPDRIYAGAWNGSLDSQTIHPSCKKMDQKIDRLQMQCWAKIYGKVHEPMGQSSQGTCFEKNERKTKGGKKWIKEQWLVLEKKLTKTQHSCTIGRIVQRMPLKKFSYFAAAGIAANWKKWTKQKSGELSWTSLSSTAKTLLKVEPNLDSSLSWIRGHWPRIFLLQLELRQIVAGAISRKLTSNKRQAKATSDKRQAPGFRIQAASVKRQAYLKIFLCLNIPDALVHVSGLRLPGSGFLFPHKVLER